MAVPVMLGAVPGALLPAPLLGVLKSGGLVQDLIIPRLVAQTLDFNVHGLWLESGGVFRFLECRGLGSIGCRHPQAVL